MSSLFRAESKVSDVHSLPEPGLRGGVENGIERNVLQGQAEMRSVSCVGCDDQGRESKVI